MNLMVLPNQRYFELLNFIKPSGCLPDTSANEYKKKYITQIKSTMFYQEYIEKKPDFKLKYLETLTEDAIGRLEKHDGNGVTDFSDIIDCLR